MNRGGAEEPWNYRHRRNEAVASLWTPRRLGTYHRAIASLRYQCADVANWSSSPIAVLLDDVLQDLAHQLRDVFAVPGSWAWSSFERGRLPDPVGPQAQTQEWASLPIEVVTTAPGEDPRVFVGRSAGHGIGCVPRRGRRVGMAAMVRV
ncbi:hypothetical protein RXR86_28710, partial [Pseudomonas aeruginosa]|nr:hypothetical protein [Pseudomonas aeruginosa]